MTQQCHYTREAPWWDESRVARSSPGSPTNRCLTRPRRRHDVVCRAPAPGRVARTGLVTPRRCGHPATARRPRGVGRPRRDDHRRRHDDRGQISIRVPNDRRRGIASARFMCPSKPSSVARHSEPVWAKTSKATRVFFARFNNSTRAIPDDEVTAYVATHWQP